MCVWEKSGALWKAKKKQKLGHAKMRTKLGSCYTLCFYVYITYFSYTCGLCVWGKE